MPPRLLENIIKYGLLIVTYPIWWPILRTLWSELQVALWREGGLLGRPPSEEEAVHLEKKYASHPSPLISESFVQFQRREKQEELERREAKRRRGPKNADPEPNAIVRPAGPRGAASRRGPTLRRTGTGKAGRGRGAKSPGGLGRASGSGRPGGFGDTGGATRKRRGF